MAKPGVEDLRVIGQYSGRVIVGLGLLMTVPILTSVIFAEWDAALDFSIALAISLIAGYGLMLASGPVRREVTWLHGMVTVAASWLAVSALGAVGYYLSGHYGSYIDAIFDVMSGLTTTGVFLLQDLDHVSNGLNMWRHLLTYVGGQGVVVLALTFLVRDAAGAFKIYVGEAKEERLLPNVVHTARAIWFISLVYLVVGTAVSWAFATAAGMPAGRGFLHGLWLFMGGWSTGGFAPQSQNLLYYHSPGVEVVTLIYSVIGSLNFALHYAVWTGNRREIYRNVETVSFLITSLVLSSIGLAGLARMNAFSGAIGLFRRGFYQFISGHTTTGFMTIYAPQFRDAWGDTAILAIIVAMLFGGSACSTAGGFKGLRVSILWKAALQDVKRLVSPEKSVVVERFHYLREVVLEDRHVRQAMLIVIAYVLTFALGTLATVLAGVPMTQAAFESASVTGNVGLTIGVTVPAMPAALKLVYIGIMWAGRMEFMSVLAIAGFVAAGLKRR